MKRRLIIGNALLFAMGATGCDDEAPPDEPPAIDCNCVADMTPDVGFIDMAAIDMARADGGALDQAVRDMAEADQAVADMAWADMAEADRGVVDMAWADMARPDMAAPDMAAPDMAAPDMAEPDMAEPDMAAMDMAAPDMAAPEGCDALRGRACELEGQQGCCDSMGTVVLACENGVFQPPMAFVGCFCEGIDAPPPQAIICAVPGFVGVHVAGWRPRRARRLRLAA